MKTAKEYFDSIRTGRKNAMQRPASSYIDRTLRKMIEDANTKGDCIINTGNGYYRPNPRDAIDDADLNIYLAKELKRARSIQQKRLSMRLVYERMKEDGVFADYSREA